MRNATPWRWLLLLAGLGAVSACAQLPGGSAYTSVQVDPRLATERYLSPASDAEEVAQTRALGGVWAKMGTAPNTAPATPVVASSNEQPVIHTASIEMSALPPAAAPAAGTESAANPRRTLWDKQPWEVELDKMVRGICRGC